MIIKPTKTPSPIMTNGISLKKITTVGLGALAGTVAAFGAVAIATTAARMPQHRAAQTHAVPFLMCVVVAGTSLFTAAAASTED
jgi:formate/nitrite transporter FocA (FNT family)